MTRLTKIIAAVLALVLLTSCAGGTVGSSPADSSSGTSSSKTPLPESYPTEPIKREDTGEMRELAQKAYGDLIKNFWNETENRLYKESQGYVIPDYRRQGTVWAHSMVMFCMDTLYLTTGDEDIHSKIAAHWGFTKENFTLEQFTTPGITPNDACDDTAWNAMAYMIYYRHTKDPYILEIMKKLLYNAYDFYKNGTLENGLWYRTRDDHEGAYEYTSIYSAGLILATLDYCEIAKDETLLGYAKTSYEYLESHLLRNGKKEYEDFTVDCNDLLYFAEFNYNRKMHEKNGPCGGTRPNDIKEAGSVSMLAGNMAMGVLHARYYKLTGDEHYKTRALETARAISNSPFYVTDKGVLVNDRDAWTGCTFARYWAEDVLTLPGISDKEIDLIYNTARSIYKNARTDAGYYGGSWSGPAEGPGSKWWVGGSKPEQFMTSGNSALMIMGAGYLEKVIAG